MEATRLGSAGLIKSRSSNFPEKSNPTKSSAKPQNVKALKGRYSDLLKDSEVR